MSSSDEVAVDGVDSFPEWFEESPVPLDRSTASVVVVDNIAQAEMDRYEKLVGFLRNQVFGKQLGGFASFGSIVEDGLYVPVSHASDGQPSKTLGYAFIEYETAEEASRAVSEANGKKFDSKHVMAVNHFDDFERLQAMSGEWVAPLKSDFEQAVALNSWLMDEQGRDQLVVRHGIDTQIYWNDPYRKANEFGRTYKYGGEREKSQDKHWTDLYVAWSQRGTYLTTFHMQGIALWGGDSFEKLGRMAHPAVAFIDFSPNEKYVVTSNGREKVSKTDPEAIIVWDVRSQKKMRGFDKGEPAPAKADGDKADGKKAEQAQQQQTPQSWPVFKWSATTAAHIPLSHQHHAASALCTCCCPSSLVVEPRSTTSHAATPHSHLSLSRLQCSIPTQIFY